MHMSCNYQFFNLFSVLSFPCSGQGNQRHPFQFTHLIQLLVSFIFSIIFSFLLYIYYIYIYKYIFIQLYKNIYMYIYICVYVCVCVCVYIYICPANSPQQRFSFRSLRILTYMIVQSSFKDSRYPYASFCTILCGNLP